MCGVRDSGSRLTISPYDDGWLMGLEEACVGPCLRGKHGDMRPYDQVRLFCAMAAHEVNRVYCRALGDLSQVEWDIAPEWQRTSSLNGVNRVFAGAGPSASHESWMAEKLDAGWTHGAVKDPEAKTHPCIVPFSELPFEQQQKDVLFVATVHAMAASLGHPVPGMAPAIQVSDGLKVTTRPA